MTDTNTLAPCPFCGERAETDFIPEHHSYQIECSDSIGCTARITRDSELGAIEAWNCRAALAAPAQAVPAPGVEAVSEREFKQFLSDVLTSAGLVTHGKKCKDLGRRLGEMSMRLRTAPKTAAAPVQAGEYPPLGKGSLWRDAEGIRGYGTDPGTGPWYTTEDVHKAINADRAARAAYSRSMDLVRTFWQQHTQADALSMTMAELHADVELVIRAAPSSAAPQPAAQAGEYPELPDLESAFAPFWSAILGWRDAVPGKASSEAAREIEKLVAAQMRAYVDADRAARGAAQAAPVDAAVLRDAERLDFMIESCTQVATISPSGRKYLCYPDGRMQAGSYPTARAAIDAAAQKGTND